MNLFKKIHLLTWKEVWQRKGEILYLLIYSLQVFNSQVWARLKPGIMNPTLFSTTTQILETQIFGQPFSAYSSTLAGSQIRNMAARIQTGPLIWNDRITSCGLTCSTTKPVPIFSFLIYILPLATVSNWWLKL